MTFSLDQIRGTKRDVPERIVIHGIHKVGKTTFAAGCPGVVFLPTEDGQDAVDVQSFPLATSWGDLIEAVGALYQGEHDFKAVCLDSVDWAMQLAYRKVCDAHDTDNIEEVLKGFGKGYVLAADLLRELLDGFNALRLERGMRVIILAHTEIKRFDDPEAESYDRYQIKLQKTSGKILQEWADVIGFAKSDTATTEGKKEKFSGETRTRVIDLGRRVLKLQRAAAYDAGNRYGLPAEVPLRWDAFEDALKAAKGGGDANGEGAEKK